MTDIEQARRMFQDAGLSFPKLPGSLADDIKGAKQMAFLDTQAQRCHPTFSIIMSRTILALACPTSCSPIQGMVSTHTQSSTTL